MHSQTPALSLGAQTATVSVAQSRGDSVDITAPGRTGERERAARRDGRAQPRHGRFSWKYQESKANVNTLREEVGKPEDLDYTAASSFALTEKS